jgi:hypothetical protein
MRDSIHLIIALDMCKVKAGNFGKLVIPGMFLFFSVSRLIGVKGTGIDAEYGNNLSPNLLQLLSLCTESYKTFLPASRNYLLLPYTCPGQ